MQEYIQTIDKLEEALSYLKAQSAVAVDTETTGLDFITDKILLIQVGNEFNQYVFDVNSLGSDIYPLLDWMKNKEVVKVFHNAKFDYSFFKTNFDVELENIRCTMVANQLLTQGLKLSSSLKAILDKYLGIGMSKEEQASFIGMSMGDKFSPEQIKYAADDVKHLMNLYKKLQTLLLERDMGTLAELEYETIRVTADLEINGIYINKDKWLALKDSAEQRMLNAKAELDEHFKPHCGVDLFGGADVNYNSPKQIQPVLQKITGQLIESTGEFALKRIQHPVIECLLKYREATKKMSTYGSEFIDKYVHPSTDRIHSQFKQLGADSGRFASKDPNMTNIPSEAEYRAAFTTQSDDYKLIAADFSGQELRLLAHLSQENQFIHALNNNMDLHSYSASLIFGIDYDSFFDEEGNIKKEMKKKYRNPAKSLTFGLIYGIGPYKLAANLNISKEEARELMNRYFKTFPKIKYTLDQLSNFARKNKYALSPLDKRRRDLSTFDWDNGRQVAHALNISKNLPFQGAGASTTKLALCRIKKAIDSNNYDAKIVNVIHDEVLVECHKDQADDIAKMVETEMTKAFNYFAPSIPMDVEAEIGDYWIH
tara:strand:- start:7953 stop:9743 length:1791 start_codon:yes stop_codon:yes gene_type:complete